MASTAPPPATTLKILTVGSALGSIRELFAKIKAIDAKHGKFDLTLCTGDFFGPVKDDVEDEKGDVAQLLQGKLEAPLPCYVMQGELPLPQTVIDKFSETSGELCNNVFLLSKSAIFTTAEGLRISCLGGVYNSKIYDVSELPHGFSSPYYTAQTVSKLLSNSLSTSAPKGSSLSSILSTTNASSLVDILICHSWPSCITAFSSAPLPSPELADIGAPPLDEVIRQIKPRYILASGGGKPPCFWEREPFVWANESGRASRFVSLGSFGGETVGGKKQRWFYAFSIATLSPVSATPVSKESLPKATGADGARRQTYVVPARFLSEPTSFAERTKPPEGYVCVICNTSGHLVRDCPTRHAVGDTGGRKPRPGYICRACGSEEHYIEDCLVVKEHVGPNSDHRGVGNRARGPPKEIGPDECWFCLSNPRLAKHLIVAIGGECYLTLPKGQLIPTHDAEGYKDKGAEIPTVPGGGHVLIVPIAHFATLSSIPQDLREPVMQEVNKYKAALRAFYAKHSAIPIFFEVGRLSVKGGHSHIQVVPVPRSFRDQVESAFVDEGHSHGIQFDLEEAGAKVPGQDARSYFRVELPDARRLVHWMQDGVPFSVQFGRLVLSKLLKMEDRLDWKACVQSEEDDKTDVQAFKTAFAPFDPIT
ncbi:hypothetical protein EW146_g1707 [Bondarzewia mesenterica]|uniref:CCHC-type domain-containing protein n=1 Tax=Bondarzewia mesenterica TaxID=1095465 RepID=A0A4V3XG01_9AGAM|nr:hypothetical protein EW146_g1707 [Bondarzewia mesenterica]